MEKKKALASSPNLPMSGCWSKRNGKVDFGNYRLSTLVCQLRNSSITNSINTPMSIGINENFMGERTYIYDMIRKNYRGE